MSVRTQVQRFWGEIAQSDKDSLARAYISDELLESKYWPFDFQHWSSGRPRF